jgi:hypothetical protein
VARVVFKASLPVLLVMMTVASVQQVWAGENRILKATDFRRGEVYCQGFSVDEPIEIDIHAIGAGWGSRTLSAYGWIIRTGSLEPVWVMDRRNTDPMGRREYLREYDSSFELEPGSYEAYFYAGSPFYTGSINFDQIGLEALYEYLIKMFGGESTVEKKDLDANLEELKKEMEELKEELKNLQDEYRDQKGMSISSSDFEDYMLEITTDSRAFKLTDCSYSQKDIVAKILEPENDLYATTGFSLSKPVRVEIKAIGEYSTFNDLFVDHGWIIDAKTREQVWGMDRRNTRYAGGDDKNRAIVEEMTLQPGDYLVYYVTDDSHTFDDWNAAPPYNPLAYGITVKAVDDEELRYVSKYQDKYSETALISIVRVGDDECIQQPFEVTRDCDVRIYAIGEYSSGSGEFVDYGWIEKVGSNGAFWEMTSRNTRHAGGAAKNRMFDDVVHLPKGVYNLGYITDGSHSYVDWNAAPPYDQKNYGITLYAVGDKFDPSSIRKLDQLPASGNTLVKMTCIGDDADVSRTFTLKRPTKVRIYALGEGDESEMYDFGWIEDRGSGQVVWEMTYRKTRYAGGADKNRKVDDEIMLDAGEYRVVYVSDGSHSFGDWNAERPRDPYNWGITVSEVGDK